jgi:hypothetical protein
MTRRTLAVLTLGALLLGCGKYGPPLRASEAGVGPVTAGHARDCEDPQHDHAEAEATP